jgi:hypothetical protein
MAFQERSPIVGTASVTHFQGQPLTFVFGSNLSGCHGAGAALHAKRAFGAQYRVGEGLTGQAYALPTKATPAVDDTLPLTDVLARIETFKQVAATTPDRVYQVTRVGCGLAGLGEFEDIIRDAFMDAPSNCLLPGIWEAHRELGLTRLIVAGSRGVNDYGKLRNWLDTLLAHRDPEKVFIISGTASGVDQLGEQYAHDRGLALWRMPALWKTQGKAAGYLRNQQMAWFGTHLAALWDGESPGTRAMIRIATKDGLSVRVKHLQPEAFPST